MSQKTHILACFAAALGACVFAFQATESATAQQAKSKLTVINESAPNKVPGRYIVVFRGRDARDLAKAKDGDVLNMMAKAKDAIERSAFGVEILHNAANSLAIRVPSTVEQNQASFLSLLSTLQKNGAVHIEAVQRASLDAVPIGLDRIDQRLLPLNRSNFSPFAGKDGMDVHVYVVDSGVDKDHSELKGRVTTEYSFGCFKGDGSADDGSPAKCDPQIGPDAPDNIGDCSGHGTAVAGIVGGTNVGVAKNVAIHSVRVASRECQITTETLVAGIDWLLTHKLLTPAVVNISLSFPLGFGPNAPLKDCPETLEDCLKLENQLFDLMRIKDVTVVVSAGNRHADACAFTPGRVKGDPSKPDRGVTTVGATYLGLFDPFDIEAPFTNYGQCVDIFAPGREIDTAAANDGAVGLCPPVEQAPRSTIQLITCTGTSMSAAHVSGCAALHLHNSPELTRQALWDELFDTANHKDTMTPKMMNDTAGWGDGILSPDSAMQTPQGIPQRPPQRINVGHSGTPNILLQCGP